MKIFIAGEFGFPKGGAPTERIKNVALGLSENHNEVTILPIVPTPQSGEQQDLIPFSGKVNYLNNGGIFGNRSGKKQEEVKISNTSLIWKVIWFFSSYPLAWLTAWRAWRKLEFGPDDVLFLYGRSFIKLFPILLVFKMRSAKTIFDIVEITDSFSGFGGKLSPIYADWKLGAWLLPKMADAITVISTPLRDRFRHLNQQIYLLPSMGHWPESPPFIETELNEKKPFKFLYLGALTRKDAPDILYKVFDQLVERIGTSRLQLLIAGRYESCEEGLYWKKKFEQNERLRPCLRLLGELNGDDFEDTMQAIDGIILLRRNSEVEKNSFPTRLIEYLQLSKPVFTTKLGDIGRYLTNMSDAIVLPPDNVDEMVDQFIEFLDKRDHWNAIGLNGWKTGKKLFNRQEHTRQLVDFIHADHQS